MTLFLTLLFIILILKGISRTEIKARCCIVDCKNETRWNFLYWITACILTTSWYPYVCEEHWELFIETGEEDQVKLRERIEKP